MNAPLNVDTMSDQEIKAHAYDQLAFIEQSQANLQILNNELRRRAGLLAEKLIAESKPENAA